VSSVIDLVQAAFEANPIYWAGIGATPRGAQARAHRARHRRAPPSARSRRVRHRTERSTTEA